MYIRHPQEPPPGLPRVDRGDDASMHAYWDTDLKCWFASDGYHEWFGIQAEQLSNTSLADLLGPTLFRENEAYIQAALAGAPQHFESIAVSPAGVARTSMTCYLPHLVDGQVAGFTMQISETSEHHTTWESFKQLAEQFSRTNSLQRNPDLYNLPVQQYGLMGAWRWEVDTDVTSWSNTLYEIFGRDRRLKPPTFAEHPNFYTPSSFKLLERAVAQMVSTGEPYLLELEYIHSSGRKGWIEARSSAERDPASGRLLALRGTAQDITARRLDRESAAQAARIAELERALRASQARVDELEVALVHAQAAVDQGQVPAGASLVDLSSMLQCCADELRATAPHGITLRVETDPAGLAHCVRADAECLQMAVSHLTANAREAMPQGGTLVLGLVDTARRPVPQMPTARSMVGLQVRDSGCGMDADTLRRAREAASTSQSCPPTGGGGLATVHTFAQRVGGFLVLESAPGLGTTATLLLPVASDRADDVESDRTIEARNTSTE
ncbi:PAS domain-containing protein [Xylophilus sp. Kf1]|nr:PAS domain-containing protein [Xylophilus sp. Kf1]